MREAHGRRSLPEAAAVKRQYDPTNFFRLEPEHQSGLTKHRPPNAYLVLPIAGCGGLRRVSIISSTPIAAKPITIKPSI